MKNLQRMYGLARVQLPDYSIEELDDIVDWSQPDEIRDTDAPTSAAFTRYGLMFSVLEPVDAEEKLKTKTEVRYRYNCAYLFSRPTTGRTSVMSA